VLPVHDGAKHSGETVRQQVETIMTSPSSRFLRRLNLATKVASATAAIAALASPALVGIAAAPGIHAQAQSSSQPAAEAIPKLEVASVKPCKDDVDPGFKGGRGISSPGVLDLKCESLRRLIARAYVYYRDAQFNALRAYQGIDGGPDWIEDDLYSITAKPEGIAGEGMMNGPMLQALLEDRFKLRIHRETKEVPVYELTVAKSGLKAPRYARGSCTPFDWAHPVPGQEPAPGQKFCAGSVTRKGAIATAQLDAMSMAAFAKTFLARFDLGCPVIDKTGLAGLFDFHLEYAPDQAGPDGAAAADPGVPSIFTVLQQQLGLKLTPARGPGEFLVIDHVERPSEN
jgi:uncharacterized protein (TIGR03435 family)